MSRTQRFGLVLDSTEKAAIGHLAELEGGLSKAALVRTLIRQAALERGVWPAPTPKSAIDLKANGREAERSNA